MKRFTVHCGLFLVVFNVLINAAIVINRSSKDFAWQSTKVPASSVPRTGNPRRGESPDRSKKLSRREKCCNLGKEVAKIGETCTYAANVDRIHPDSHFHQMKTSVWMRHSHPITRRSLQKCKPFKVFYEKCCHYERSLITKDLLEAKRKINQYLREIRKNEADEDEGSSNEQGGLPEESRETSQKGSKYSS